MGDGGSTTIALNAERFLSARTAESVLVSAVNSDAHKTVHLLMAPLKYVESQFAKCCVSSQDAPEKVYLQTLRFAAALCTTPLIGADNTVYTEWLADGVASVQSHWNGRTPSGLYQVEVKEVFVGLLRSMLDRGGGIVLMEEMEAPQWFVVLPRQCDQRVEIELLWRQLPANAGICLMKGPDFKSLMDRTDFGIGIRAPSAFFLIYAQLDVFPSWSGGNSILPATTGIKPRTGCFVALGVEGEGGRRALVDFLWDLLKVECKVTYDMRSVDRQSMVTVEFPFSQDTERAVSVLTKVATVVKVESSFEDTDKHYAMQFSTDAAHAMYRNGASVVREEGGGSQQVALLQGQVQGIARDMQQFIQFTSAALIDQQQAGGQLRGHWPGTGCAWSRDSDAISRGVGRSARPPFHMAWPDTLCTVGSLHGG